MSEIKNRNKTNLVTSVEKTKAGGVTKEEKTTGERLAPKPSSNLPLRVVSRIVVITSLLIIVYFSTSNDTFKPLAKQTEEITGKGQVVECSQEYLQELNTFDNCMPRDCGRYVTDSVISKREAADLLTILKKGLRLAGSSGGASILDLHSGALSKGHHFVNIFKLQEAKGLFTESDFTVYRIVKEKIKFAISHHFGVSPEKIFLTHPTFFSEITPKKAMTVHDEYWHPHVDKETYKSFHYTTLLYLNDYNIDFHGGRFVFIDPKFNRTVEPRKARLSMFTSGAENLHYVEKVKSGVRCAMTISFTCDKQYAIEDPSLNKYE